MTTDTVRETILGLLMDIAPEVQADQLKPDVSIRDQVDIDSMDLLNFLTSVHKQFGIEIPERDYSRLMTLNDCANYVEAALSRSGN